MTVFRSPLQPDCCRYSWTSGNVPYSYAGAFKSHLFLSANPLDVKGALQAGCAAAYIYNNTMIKNNDEEELRIAFDGDSVLFSGESERVFQEQGYEAFLDNEERLMKKPLAHGPLHGFLRALHKIQQHFTSGTCPIRTALVTARSAPTHERVIRTFRAWDIRIDEALFLGGLDKADFLRAFRADIYFDDQLQHCESTAKHVATGQVIAD